VRTRVGPTLEGAVRTLVGPTFRSGEASAISLAQTGVNLGERGRLLFAARLRLGMRPRNGPIDAVR
jgi:hypothetical protein